MVSVTELWLIKKSCLDRIDGVAICDNSLVQENRDNFLNLTRQAMALVQSLDSRRYRRVCEQLHYIVNMDLIAGGNFARRFKICHVDYSRLATNNPIWNLRQYAQLLVHEATHGLLYQKGITYDKEHRERIERLCRLEEYRFALRFEPGYADRSVEPFNLEWYEKYWDGKSRRAAEWKRLWESIKAGRKAAKDAKAGNVPAPIPVDAKSYNDLGEACEREGDDARAIAYFSHAIQLDPQFARAFDNRGQSYHAEGRYDDAIRDYDRAIQLDPKHAKAYVRRGLTYRFKGEYDKAIADDTVAIELDPQFAQAYNNRGYATLCKGEYEKAIVDFDRAIQLNPDYATAYGNRGRTYRTTGNYEKAIADYSRLMALEPEHASAHNNLAWLLVTHPDLACRDGKKAVELATQACELSNWKNTSAINTLALACAEVGDMENAVKWQARYLESPDLSPSKIAGAKHRLAMYRSYLPRPSD